MYCNEHFVHDKIKCLIITKVSGVLVPRSLALGAGAGVPDIKLTRHVSVL